MRISDWSSDVCSSDRDLAGNRLFHQFAPAMGFEAVFLMRRTGDDGQAGGAQALEQAGRGMRLRAGLGDAGLGELGAAFLRDRLAQDFEQDGDRKSVV